MGVRRMGSWMWPAHAALLVVCLCSCGMMGASGAAPLRPYSMAITYGFTTEALRTKKELAAQTETSLLPGAADLEDVPFFTDISAFVRRWKRGRTKPLPTRDNCDLSSFPKSGCVVRNNMALCRAQVSVDKKGFLWNADVAFVVRYSSCPDRSLDERDKPIPTTFVVRPNVTETLLIDGNREWKGILPAQRPSIAFSLKRDEPPAAKDGSSAPKSAMLLAPVKVTAVAPGAAGSLPMELSVRMDEVKASPKTFSSKVTFECKSLGASVATYDVGRISLQTDS
uniref:Uncharacterized protein n=1 Tax=Hemiselmis andersenii TaxID=464988 RepID=A0A7S1GVH4_HEMAN